MRQWLRRAGSAGSLPGGCAGRRDERGASAVEFALVCPLLLMLLFGIITTGLSYDHGLGLTNAVREGTRFGASTDASPTMAGQWADDLITEVRQTQFDDPSSQTQVCVQLWKVGTGAVANTGKCSVGAGTTVAVPLTANDDPKVPSLPAGTCVVRVVAARPFNILIGVASWDRYQSSSSVARYERKDKISTCS